MDTKRSPVASKLHLKSLKVPVKSFGSRYFPVFLSLVLFITIFFFAVVIGYKSNLINQKTPQLSVREIISTEAQKYCEAKEGTWLPDYKECESYETNKGITQSECESLGGSYADCNSACRHDSGYPDNVCIDVCVQTCQFK